MCDLSPNLIAWLDRELPEGEAACIERHLLKCADCRCRLDSYRRAGATFDAYCDALASKAFGGSPRWLPARSAAVAASTAMAATFACALFLLFARARMETPLVPSASLVVASPSVLQNATPPPVARIYRRHSARSRDAHWVAAQPAIQVAIPAEAIFPPGAIPEGVNFTAEVTIAPDGSAQTLSLQPQLIEVERKLAQP